jgi:DNA (cytosine-5)-methyltransferase 1
LEVVMRAYYNEVDEYCCDWLSNLMDAGHITAGRIDERPIQEVTAGDVYGYDRVHFFAGIGGWDHALSLCGYAGPVWTGSCPCQPFSAAGKGKSADDGRHLWPAWFSLIRECRPAVVFGEQVEAAIGWGWLDAVFADLEAEGYACGATVLPACGVGAPHIRQRVWFVGQSIGDELGWQRGNAFGEKAKGDSARQVAGSGGVGSRSASAAGGLADANTARCGAGRAGEAGNGGDTARLEPSGLWASCDWLPCTDGKARPVEPGTFPLAHGIPGRVGRLRAYGNAIVPQVAAEFIRAACGDCCRK